METTPIWTCLTTMIPSWMAITNHHHRRKAAVRTVVMTRTPFLSPLTTAEDANMQIVDLMDRMISYYRMSTRTKKWTMRMVMHFTDLALANSWLLYRKDHAICAGPKTRPIQFLQCRMEVATILLAQHHGADADLSTQSEEEEDSNQGVKRHVTELPHVSVRRRANAHLPEMIGLKNAMRCRQLGCTGRTRVRCMTCKVFLCLQTEHNCYSAFHT